MLSFTIATHATSPFMEHSVVASAGGGTALSLAVVDAADVEQHFASLAEGGRVHAPLQRTFFAARFGLVTDRDGVSWIVVATS